MSTVEHNMYKNIRTSSLIPGNVYSMMTWRKTPRYDDVKFIGFVDVNGEASKGKMLNRMQPGDVFLFETLSGYPVHGIGKDLCLVREDTSERITFAEVVHDAELIAA